VEPRKPEARLQGRVGNDAIAEYPATGSGYARACEVISRESCRCNARPRRHKGTPGETISNSAAADARASDRMAGKSQTPAAASKARSATSDVPAEAPAAASKARSTASDVPTEAAASAATTAWTGLSFVADRRDCEEQDRRGGYASYHASLGRGDRFEYRCARRR